MIKNWSNEYALGIAEVDAQHKGFFEAAHGLYDSILNCEGEKSVEETLEFLKDYANRHFQAEELLMAKHGFPGLPRHQGLHAAFFEDLDALLDDLRIFGPSQDLADRALEAAQEWLIDHIIDEDSQYAAYVAKKE